LQKFLNETLIWQTNIAQRLPSMYEEQLFVFQSTDTIVWDSDDDGSGSSSVAYQ
jgi:hypothetical protein